jgi:hypothetical protein
MLTGQSDVRPIRAELDGHRSLAEAHQRVRQLEQEVAQLREAVAARQQIGIATGLLSRRFGCTPQQAWRLLIRVSQDANVKVRKIADVLIDEHCGQVRPEDRLTADLLHEHLPADPSPAAGGRPASPDRKS